MRMHQSYCSTESYRNTEAQASHFIFLDSMDGPPASVASALLGFPAVSPQPFPRSRVCCCSPQVPCMSGAPVQVSDDEFPISCLHVTSPPRPAAHAAAASPTDSDDELPIPRFSHHPALVSWDGDAEVSLRRRSVSHLTTPPPLVLFAPNPPRTGWRLRPMPSRVWLIPVCLFSFVVAQYTDDAVCSRRDRCHSFAPS
jgi:hypothetical protein